MRKTALANMIQSSGFSELAFGIQDSRFNLRTSNYAKNQQWQTGFMVQDSGFKVQDSGFVIQYLEFKVMDKVFGI